MIIQGTTIRTYLSIDTHANSIHTRLYKQATVIRIDRNVEKCWKEQADMSTWCNESWNEFREFYAWSSSVYENKPVFSSVGGMREKSKLKICNKKMLYWLWRLIVSLMVDLFQILKRIYGVQTKPYLWII